MHFFPDYPIDGVSFKFRGGTAVVICHEKSKWCAEPTKLAKGEIPGKTLTCHLFPFPAEDFIKTGFTPSSAMIGIGLDATCKTGQGGRLSVIPHRGMRKTNIQSPTAIGNLVWDVSFRLIVKGLKTGRQNFTELFVKAVSQRHQGIEPALPSALVYGASHNDNDATFDPIASKHENESPYQKNIAVVAGDDHATTSVRVQDDLNSDPDRDASPFRLLASEWAVLKPLVDAGHGPATDHRKNVEAVLHQHLTGCPWTKLPKEYGPWKTSHKCFLRWKTREVLPTIIKHLEQRVTPRLVGLKTTLDDFSRSIDPLEKKIGGELTKLLDSILSERSE